MPFFAIFINVFIKTKFDQFFKKIYDVTMGHVLMATIPRPHINHCCQMFKDKII